jgi:bifunctional UDP-N-acetylglucosamine pyrophosphorylase/glucosamine-1-phosphate N-acetyltransferase
MNTDPLKNHVPGSKRVAELIRRGATIPCPASVEIDDSVLPERIAPGVVIHSGCRITGSQTSIGPECVIGAEAPATVENCQLGRKVSLGGGYFSESTFLDGARMGSGSHVRAGTILEEEASGAHTAGFKQTILLPFVTAGSLINFCDCLMAGGNSRKNHSEVGSSYIHFNFTPRQDKATASLIGDVPRGVMLNQPPIFLGGQGGLVGPVRIAYGTVIPAGIICRSDILDENQLFMPPVASVEPQNNPRHQYRSINRIVANNLIYIGNLHALKSWYLFARKRFMSRDIYARACWAGGVNRLEAGIVERVKRLRELAERMPRSLEIARVQGNLSNAFLMQQESLISKWPEMELCLEHGPDEVTKAVERDFFLEKWNEINPEIPYIDAVVGLSKEARAAGTIWLQGIVDSAASLWKEI